MDERHDIRKDLAQSFERYADCIQSDSNDTERSRRTVLEAMERLNEFDSERRAAERQKHLSHTRHKIKKPPGRNPSGLNSNGNYYGPS